jgi:hypothetical protein
MSEDFEEQLRHALRAVDPPRDISAIVAARLGATRPPEKRRGVWAWPVGLAASVLLVAGYQYQRHVQEVSAGLEARRQVIEALRVTNEKLDLAYRAVREQNANPEEKGSGV